MSIHTPFHALLLVLYIYTVYSSCLFYYSLFLWYVLLALSQQRKTHYCEV